MKRMLNYEDLFRRYKKEGVIVDTSILLLWFVGSYDEGQIAKFKRTRTLFTVEDYVTLCGILRRFDKIITTPNILTEVSNLAGQMEEPMRTRQFEAFARGIMLLDEKCLPSTRIAATEEFKRFGLTDAAISCLASAKCLTITSDLRLYVHLQRLGLDAVNFNHIRALGWEQ